ncbi:MAG: PLP-dependent aminotransferase family protein, partial [Gemmatimonadales bacterium]
MTTLIKKRATKTVIAMIPLDTARAEPLQEQIYARIREDIVGGKLLPGDRLPSTRVLAADLDVSRNTVMAAFEKLRLEGYVVGEVGGGTYVADVLPDSTLAPAISAAQPRSESARKPRLSERGRTLAETDVSWASKSRTGIAFRVGAPAFDSFPYALWNRLESAIWRHPTRKLVAYGDPLGYKPLREAIAAYLTTSRGVKCDASCVLIVDGSQQALDLAVRVLVDPGQRAWLEDPGYLGARAAMRGNGAEVVPVPVDDEGLDVAEGIRRCPSPNLIYVTPSRHFPLGSVMSLRRRY